MSNKKALFPTTLTSESLDCLKNVISYCEENNLELYILYTYRLISHGSNQSGSSQSIKKELENKATFIFDKLEEEILSKSKIKYTFLSEVGFITDRVILTLNKHDIDSVILCSACADLLETEMKGNDPNITIDNKPVILID